MQVNRQVVWSTPEGEYEVDLVAAADATVGDLRAALTGGRPGDLRVGEHLAPADHGLDEAGLHVGAVVALPGAVRTPAPPPVAELRVVGGLDAGHTVALAPGEVVLGRGPDAGLDLGSGTVSRRHAALDVGLAGTARLTDLGTTNGTAVDGAPASGEPVDVPAGAVVELGTVAVTVGPPAEPDRPLGLDPRRDTGSTGTLAFNRPPRTALPPGAGPLHAPVPPAQSDRPPFSLVALLAPVLVAVVLVQVTGSWQFALFALLSPVMVLGNHYEARRRSRRSLRRDTRAYQADLAAFRAEVAARRAAEAAARRAATPDLAETLRRAEGPSVRLWERRPGSADFLRLSAGLAELPWSPPLADAGTAPTGETAAVLEEAASLPAVPVEVDLAGGGVVGVVGHRDAALALARSLLCQAAVQTGPADLRVAVLVDDERAPAWDWAKWLPHTRDPAGAADGRLLAAGGDACAALLRDLLGGADTSEDRAAPVRRTDEPAAPVLLAVVDAERLLDGRGAPGRALLRGVAGPVAGIVLAGSADRLPAVCTTVVECLDEDGYAVVRRPQRGETVEDVPLAGLAEPTARRCARALARFEDPELVSADAGLPDRVDLLPLLDLPALDAPSVRARWTGSAAVPRPVGVVGVGEHGPFALDLLADGPHGLVGGTTGSGKSELLRTVVASLAVGSSPDDLTFVLVDYKGGSAFDECARLPHTVGLVTDLDEQLGERALRCLEAELRHRERRLRDAGVPDLVEWQALRLRDPQRAGEPLPRLVVVIDEFATLAAELPHFLSALVGVAQRGRSLGVHLLLATQRPSGAVDENIKANTNLRIALRVQSGPDSVDVIGTPDAARIARGRAGRAYVRLGADEVVPVQTALVTGVTRAAGGPSVDAAPFCFGPRARPAVPAPAAASDAAPERTDLDRLVEVVGEAFSGLRRPLPRQPWPPPLPTAVDLATVLSGDVPGLVPFALADDPEGQAQYPTGWRPAEGNLLLYGVGGSGTTTALGSLAVALARTCSPDRLHLYVLDMGAGELAPLAELPHTGAVVGATEQERQLRLVRLLRAELDRRKDLGPAERAQEPRVVLLLDGLPGFWSEHSDALGLEVTEELTRVYADGPEVGLSVVATADRGGGVPGRLAAATTQKWLFRLPDPVDYGAFGVRAAQVPAPAPGRAVVVGAAQVVQVAVPGPSLAAGVAAAAAPAAPAPVTRVPRPVVVLPDTVDVRALGPARLPAHGPWWLPFGVLDRDFAPAGMTLYDGEHGVVAGPARSGRSTVLCALAAGARAAGARVLAVALRPSPLRTSPDVDAVATTDADAVALVRGAPAHEGPVLLLLDDAEAYDDPEGAVAALVAARPSHVHLVVAGRSDGLRSLFGHWTQRVRRSRSGVLLRPDVDLDGELLGVRLPRRERVPVRVGRGYLCTGGDVALVQAGQPSPAGPGDDGS